MRIHLRVFGLLAVGFAVAGHAEPAEPTDPRLNDLAAAAVHPGARMADDPGEVLERLVLKERDLRRDMEATSLEAKHLSDLLLARAKAYVRRARLGLLPATEGHKGLIAHASKVERLRRALSRDLERERQLTEKKLALHRELEALKVKREPLEEVARLMAANSAAVESARERALAFEQAFTRRTVDDHTAVYGAGAVDDGLRVLGAGFRAFKGRLPFPLTGRSELEPGRLPGANGPGLFMHGPVGARVRAVAKGNVAFADQYADYGASVIIDHGDGFFSVSAQLGTVDVRAGDELKAGERVGTIGAQKKLYFEVRFGTDTLDPRDWFGI